jgi:hypothetical protein
VTCVVHSWQEVDLPCPQGLGEEECPHPGVACTACPKVVDLITEPDPRDEDE